MEIVIAQSEHGISVLDIINYYIENTGYTFIDNPIPYRLYEPFLVTLGRVLSLVAVDAGRPIGVVMFKGYSPTSYFDGAVEMGIYVHKDFLGHGIGKALLNESIPLLKKKDKRVICSTVSSINGASMAFHKAMGFEDRGAYEDIGIYCGTPFSVIHYQKDI